MKFTLSTAFLFLVLGSGISQTITVTLATDSTFKDAIVETYDPNLNRGDDDIAYVQAWTFNGPNNKRYYFQFDFSVIPYNAIIDSVKLNFYKGSTHTKNQPHSGNNDFNIKRVTQPWGEHSITWNTQPSATAQNKTVVPASTSGSQNYEGIDITQLVKDAISFGNFGFVAVLMDESPFKRVVLASSDHPDAADRPSLKISYHMPCVASPAFSYSNKPGKTYIFSNHTTASGTPSYYWDFGDGTYSQQMNPTKTYPKHGTYEVCLTVVNDCDSTTTCQTLSTCTPAPSMIRYSTNVNLVQFTAFPTNALSYYWDFGDGNYSYLQNPPYAYSTNGQYNACLTTTDTCGSSTYCSTIDIHGIGLTENHELVFSIYPNPSSDIVNIEGDLSQVNQIELYTADGKKLRSLSPEQLPLRLGSHTKGSYFIKLQTKEGTQYHRLLKL